MNVHDPRQVALKPLSFYGVEMPSRLLIGTARYPSPQVMSQSVAASRASIVTVSLRREMARAGNGGQRFFDLIKELGVRVLPNTAGCRTPKEAIATAQMARELFATDWVKLEVIGNDDTLQPDLFGLVEAAAILSKDGFKVFPYTTEDLIAAERLMAAGCEVLMPWGAPIGTGRGLANRYALKTLREYFPAVPLVIDAGIGAPSHAAEAMEMGYDAVLLNTAIATAADPVRMARAFADAIEAGRDAFEAGLMQQRDMAVPSTPVAGTPFFDLDKTMTRPRGGPDLFYPIVPDLAWLQRLVPLGVKTIQLRLKDAAGRCRPPRDRRQPGHLRAPRLPAHRQRLLARSHEPRRRLRASGPGGSGRRRRARAQGQGRAPRHQHAQPRGARHRARGAAGLHRAGSDL